MIQEFHADLSRRSAPETAPPTLQLCRTVERGLETLFTVSFTCTCSQCLQVQRGKPGDTQCVMTQN